MRRLRGVLDPVLREAVGRLPEPVGIAAGYQFGWCDERGAPVVGAGGKGIRPVLALLCAEAVGGRAESAARAAAAVELVHNFSLMHDDIIDGDTTRRHRATAWAAFGIGTATLSGDALLALAVDVLAASSEGDVAGAVRLLGRALVDLADGQAADVAFETRRDVGCEEYLSMAAGKTAALISCACALGALFGGGEPGVVDRLAEFGRQLGLAFQMVDDVLGIWGDPAVTGKPAFSDLRSRKKTYPVVLALASGSEPALQFAALYRRPEPLGESEIGDAVRYLDQAGCREHTEQEARRRLELAVASLAAAAPVQHAAKDLISLARLVIDRHH
ncbi:polyprenyl synthetase family protein [Amycolatopsis sp. NPDC051071]|uniref:polyprenyl synthetase family protein n=1 Tax=Amycolatopsis sp. NPDC051071 TaxID=3154637 RepID=UPI00341C6AF4